MAKDTPQKKSPRQRAAKACQRCSNRKIKCDAADIGLPCTRCRLDGIEKCEFINSRRGTYDRAALRQRHQAKDTVHKTSQQADSVVRTTQNSGSTVNNVETNILTPPETIGNQSSYSSSAQTPANASVQAHSLASMFEQFLRNQPRDAEELIGKYGIVLLGDSSPLTFAFNELGRGTSLHEEVAAVSREPTQSMIQRQKHPSHMAEADLAFLQYRGAFKLPPSTLCYGMFDAFIDYFYPFYSIFDKEKIKNQHRSLTMPWILLNAICVIGASYCPIEMIRDAGYDTRQQCRRVFYERAKVLYDLGYETNRVVLLQSMVLLTFWGPDMKSYWNPCSWIGVAVTIAESLGIHRPGDSKPENTKEGRLLRRLWWMLTVRDVYCASLIGRPFRVNLAHCDAPLLNINDFELEDQANDSESDTRPHDQTHALYQIELLKLSLIMRKIVSLRSDTGLSISRPELYQKLQDWMTALPLCLSWSKPAATSHICSESLKVLFHHHLIFLHMARQGTSSVEGFSSVEDDDPAAAQITEHAAHMVSTTSLSLVTKSLVDLMPQEVVAGYFVAAIVFFRLMRQGNVLTAQLAQAAFENCQILLGQVRDCWDSASWGLRVIDFLVSASAASAVPTQAQDTRAPQDQGSIGNNALQYEPPTGAGATSTYANISTGFDDTSFSNMFDSLQSSSDHLLLPMWTFYDQELSFT